MADRERQVAAGKADGPMADSKAEPGKPGRAGKSVEAEGFEFQGALDGWDPQQWEAEEEAVVEVPVEDGLEGSEGGGEENAEEAGESDSAGEAEDGEGGEGRVDVSEGSPGGAGAADRGDTVKEGGSDKREELAGANGAGQPAGAGKQGKVESIPFAGQTKASGPGAEQGREDGGKLGGGGTPEGTDEAASGREQKPPAPAAAAPVVDEEVRAGLGRVEGQLVALVEVVEGLKAASSKGGEGDALEKVQKDIARQADLVGSTLKKVETATREVGKRVEDSVNVIEKSYGNIDAVAKVGEGIEVLNDRLMAYSSDLNRRIKSVGGPHRWAVIVGLAVAAPVCVVAGAFVEQEWKVLPIEDSTGGWHDHVWANYGETIVGCVQKAYRDGSSYSCVVDVRKSVEQVRRASQR